MALLKEGDTAPAFDVPKQNDIPTILAKFQGHTVVLWWYPKADTPG